ncbi:transcriptional regulator, XRE family with cupin sensor [Aureimonas altamirensis DSM 21988]|uniref:Transcriptional regulator, XRE family with cupin sensor n=1 Tax=Aureimonas altamirensis DSM 21988 TaxID=1121026 RepID=A0ABY1IGH8_9HYPH|nr:XRE family transcriptional regulator [Aureimonas altamirensis]SHJ13591.1 transcriptional regulator, XRE family with cupin sensor [Aureimonas altamirensis DSM 21988]
MTRTFEQPQAVVSEQLVQTRIDRFGQRIKSLRQDRGLTVRDLAARCGVAASTISKVENARMSPTYDIILRLALGLGAQMEALFVDEATSMRSGRRSVTRAGAGARVKAQHYDYEMLSADVSNKRFHPIVATIGIGESISSRDYVRHAGEEFVYVLSGKVRILTELYEPLTLAVGDSCYFDSAMAHVLVSEGPGNATVMWVASDLVAELG